MPYIRRRLGYIAFEVRIWMNNYTGLIYVDAITKPCANPVLIQVYMDIILVRNRTVQ